MSKGGLSTNYEANLILDGDISEPPIHDAIEYFSYLYKISVPLDDKIIELYIKSKIIFDDIKNKVTENDKINEVTIELNEYLNQKSQNDSFSELSESDYKEMLFAEEKSDEGWVLYEKGNLSDAYNLLNESYDNYQIATNTLLTHSLLP